MAKRRRGFETASDMVRSLGVVGLFVAALLLLTVRSAPPPIRADAGAAVSTAQQARLFPVLAPQGLGSGWRATSARFGDPGDAAQPGSVLHVGYLTPSGAYASLDEAAGQPLLARATGAPAGDVTVGGRRWQRLRSGQDRVLLLTVPGRTVVVYGSAPWAELERLAGALRAVS